MRERLRRVVFIVFIIVLAVLVRVRAALELPIDFDEPVYVGAGIHYAQAIRAGDLGEIIRYADNIEHPVLVKLLYGIGTALTAPDVTHLTVPQGRFAALRGGFANDALTVSRMISVGFGVALVILVTGVEPLAGLVLALHTMNTKYTSQAYLEALPAFTSALCVLACARSNGRKNRWLWLSAVALGATAASKYVYLVTGLVVGGWLLWDVKRDTLQRRDLFLFGLVALLAFFVLNPILWADPFGRLIESVTFHSAYAASDHVVRYGYAWWKPLDYMFHSWPAQWHKGVFFVSFDELIFVGGVVGLAWLLGRTRLGGYLRLGWNKVIGITVKPGVLSQAATAQPQRDALQARREGLIQAWFWVGLLFLFVWPTKWPQYTLITATPLCLAAGLVAEEAQRWLRREQAYWGKAVYDAFLHRFVVLVGALVLLLVGFVTWSSVVHRRHLQGWTIFNPETSPLPSQIVQAVALDQAGRVWLGTARGVAVLELPLRGQDGQPRWTIYNQDNSGLAGNDVLAIAAGEDGQLWIGTSQGLSRFDARRDHWTTFSSDNSPLYKGTFHDIELAPDGSVWIATAAKVSVLTPAGEWRAYNATNSGLLSDEVLDVAVQGGPTLHPELVEGEQVGAAGIRIWFATNKGVSVLDLESDTWTSYTSENSGLVWDAVSGVAVDEGGGIWLTTFGRGISTLSPDGYWRTFNPSNSGLPWGTVVTVVPGCRCGEQAAWLWFATAGPDTNQGRPVAAYMPPSLSQSDAAHGKTSSTGRWRAFGYRNSGLPDSAVSDIAVQCLEGTLSSSDPMTCEGLRVWVATRAAGVAMYEIPNP
jgi:hypothetical protein